MHLATLSRTDGNRLICGQDGSDLLLWNQRYAWELHMQANDPHAAEMPRHANQLSSLTRGGILGNPRPRSTKPTRHELLEQMMTAAALTGEKLRSKVPTSTMGVRHLRGESPTAIRCDVCHSL